MEPQKGQVTNRMLHIYKVLELREEGHRSCLSLGDLAPGPKSWSSHPKMPLFMTVLLCYRYTQGFESSLWTVKRSLNLRKSLERGPLRDFILIFIYDL